jgi:DNA-binding response OmpR family regulator
MNIKEHILIVEDHSALRILMDNFLGKTFKVKTTSNGYEALAWMNEGNIPEVIILDINMPNLSGVDFLSNIRISGFFKDIPVVVVSGEEEGKIIEKCLEIGINGYMKKPFNPNDLLTKIHTILNNNKAIKI